MDSPNIIQTALWRSAIIHLMKCFGGSTSRGQLDPKKVCKGHPPEALETFDYFKNLRDKHIVHDENAYAQSLPGAVLNGPDKSYKIEKIVCSCVIADVMGTESRENLRLLIGATHSWVCSEFDRLCELLTKELEMEPYAGLLARDSVSYRKPNASDVSGKRSRP